MLLLQLSTLIIVIGMHLITHHVSVDKEAPMSLKSADLFTIKLTLSLKLFLKEKSFCM